jgi:hypothetical protein
MTSGHGPSGRYNLPNFEQYAALGARTQIEVRLPFGVPGLQGTFEVAIASRHWQATFSPDYLPISAVIVHLDEVEGVLNDEGQLVALRSEGSTRRNQNPTPVIALSPDRWGRSWRTRAQLLVDSFIDPGYGSASPPSPDEMAETVLTPACLCINRVLDTLAFVGGTPDLPHLTPSDFWSVRVMYIDAASQLLGNFVLSSLQTLWWGAYHARLYDAEPSFRSTLTSPNGLSISDELLITSERKSHAGDFRGSIIDAVCAVEAAVGRYLDDFLTRQGMAAGLRKDFLGPHGLSLALRVAVLIPAFVQLGVPADIVAAFGQANNKRNHIVHKGARANLSEAERARAASTMFIDCLRGYSRVRHHWDAYRRFRPPPAI